MNFQDTARGDLPSPKMTALQVKVKIEFLQFCLGNPSVARWAKPHQVCAKYDKVLYIFKLKCHTNSAVNESYN